MSSSLSQCRAVILGAVLSFGATAAEPSDPTCHVGAYRLQDGRAVSLQVSDPPDTLRWMLRDGTTGKLHRADGAAWTSTLGWTDRPDGVTATFGAATTTRSRSQVFQESASRSTCGRPRSPVTAQRWSADSCCR